MTGFLNEKEFSRKSFVKGGGAMTGGISAATDSVSRSLTGSTIFGVTKSGADCFGNDGGGAGAKAWIFSSIVFVGAGGVCRSRTSSD